MFDTKRFGQTIKVFRGNEKMKVDTLAEELHISRSYLEQLERGDKAPSIDVALSIVNYFDVSFNQYIAISNNSSPIKQEIFKYLSTIKSDEIFEFLYELLLELLLYDKRGE